MRKTKLVHLQMALFGDGQGSDRDVGEERDAEKGLVARAALHAVCSHFKGSLPVPATLARIVTHDGYTGQLEVYGYGCVVQIWTTIMHSSRVALVSFKLGSHITTHRPDKPRGTFRPLFLMRWDSSVGSCNYMCVVEC